MRLRSVKGWTEDEVWQPGHYGPTRVLVLPDGRRHNLSAGQSDQLYVWREVNGPVYVVTENRSMGYLGIERFDDHGDGLELTGELFMQSPSEIIEILGDHGEDLAAHNVIRRTVDYLGE